MSKHAHSFTEAHEMETLKEGTWYIKGCKELGEYFNKIKCRWAGDDSLNGYYIANGKWGFSFIKELQDRTELTYLEFIKLFEGEGETSLQIALKALENIINPIGYMKSQLKDGESLEGHYAIMISDNPKFYQDIAKEALEEINSK